MQDAEHAARTLARTRWGSARVDRLIGDLAARPDDIGADQAARLHALLKWIDDRDKQGER